MPSTAFVGLAGTALLLAGCSSGSRSAAPSAPSAAAATPSSTAPSSARTSTSTTARGAATATSSATSSPTPSGSRSASAVAGWPTYHRTNDRTGAVTGFPRPHSLGAGWSARLDDAVYGQPLVVDGTTGGGGVVLAATENDTVYALDLATGHQRWSRHLAEPAPRSQLPCGNIDPLGITGTPAYDAATGSVFVATEAVGAHHSLVALDARTGAVRFTKDLDVTDRDRTAEQQRGALAVANGRVYVAFGGLDGDCGNYVGYLTAVATDGTGGVAHYEVPTPREGGMWAASGPAVDAAGNVFVAVGNGARTSGRYDGSDSVLKLAPDLSSRVDFFAPHDWGSDNAADADLGSTGPLLLPRAQVLIAGKTAVVYLLDGSRLGGIGGQLAQLPNCRSFGGMAYDGGAAFVPCTQGLLRVDVKGQQLHAGWRADGAVTGSPVVGGGAVWALDTGAGDLHALDEATGAPIASHHVGSVTRFASPVLAPGGRVLVGTTDGVVALTVR